MSEKFAMTAYAQARRAEGFLLAAVMCVVALAFLIPIGMRFCTILEPLKAALGN